MDSQSRYSRERACRTALPRVPFTGVVVIATLLAQFSKTGGSRWTFLEHMVQNKDGESKKRESGTII